MKKIILLSFVFVFCAAVFAQQQIPPEVLEQLPEGVQISNETIYYPPPPTATRITTEGPRQYVDLEEVRAEFEAMNARFDELESKKSITDYLPIINIILIVILFIIVMLRAKPTPRRSV